MAIAVTCRGVRRAGGKIYVRFSDKTELEFESVEQLRRECRAALQSEEAAATLKMLMLAKMLAASSDGSTVASLANRTCTLDLSLGNNIVRYT